LRRDPTIDADDVRSTFEAVSPLTVGLEEEAMLLDAGSLDLLPRAAEVVSRAADPRFKLELPAAQLEIVLPPTATVRESAAGLHAARHDLAAAAEGIGVLVAAGAHPFASPLGRLNRGERHEPIGRDYGSVAQLQLVCALQVHVAVGGHARTLAVYNALRSYLPELAALSANAPFYAGQDTGLASVRPKICDLLPRQGIPPAIRSWDAYAEDLRWGASAGALPVPGRWWWELRPHPVYGTLELRVPDAQATVSDAAAVTAVAHCLVGWLAARHDAGDLPEPDPTWRIEENRWAACRHGLDAVFADLRTGDRVRARELLAQRLTTLAPSARALRCADELADADRLLLATGAERQRAAAGGDPHAATRWLADVYARSGAAFTRTDG
jgi:glutamate---cysteine ligase / carboxylate-amine ligase